MQSSRLYWLRTTLRAGTMLVLAAATAAGAFAQSKPIHVDFPIGSTRVVLDGSVDPSGVIRYIVSPYAGQPLMIDLGSRPGSVSMSVRSNDVSYDGPASGGDHYQTIVKTTGDFEIDVTAVAGQAMGHSFDGGSFSLSVEAPARIQFPEGQNTVERNGPTPGGLPVDYFIQGQPGVVITIDLTSEGDKDTLQITGYDPFGPVFKSTKLDKDTYGVVLPSDGRCIMSVVPPGGDASVPYHLRITVNG
ncbi:MAG TPA: hypothetical protein VMW87_13135 [Spirochaetia bacterium]|nr:hypothetical protein [Spirochaetia bacterium]